jgi:hypothetical protein
MSKLHDLIFRLEEGSGKFLPRIIAAILVLLLVICAYNWFCFRNMANVEAMDCAQLARNLSEGKGFTTSFVRPLSIRVLQDRASKNPEPTAPFQTADPAQLKGNHPDLANAPVYPVILAGLMEILPFHYKADLNTRFWSSPSFDLTGEHEEISLHRFRRYQPDFLISAFNQVILLSVATLVFFTAKRLFNIPTAVLSTVLVLGTEQLWRFATSGLPTIVLMLISGCLFWCVAHLDKEAFFGEPPPRRGGKLFRLKEVPQGPPPNQLRWAALAGALVGLGALTRYPFAWMILPVLSFILLFAGPSRVSQAATAFAAFAVLLTPWLVRNWLISGLPFGTATYGILEGSILFPGDSLPRALNPDLSFSGIAFAKLTWFKLLATGAQLIQNDIPRLGGSWVGGVFIIGLLVPIGSVQARRLGYFLGVSFVVLAVAQALTQTELSAQSPAVNSENMLVLLAPWIWIYGTASFFRLLDFLEAQLLPMRPYLISAFAAVTCLPMILALLIAPRAPVVFPPYFPPWTQAAAAFVKSDELMMSDTPWAAAWYGRRQCVWAPKAKRDFFFINDRIKPIQALYLTHAEGTGRFESFGDWLQAGSEGWGDFILSCVLNKQQGKPGPPADFPLEHWQKGWPMYFLLTARDKP